MRRFAAILAVWLICAAALEIAVRATSGVPLFILKNWRAEEVTASNMKDVAQYDPLLGWTVRAGVESDWLNTIRYGIRKNKASDADVRTGGILVVGNSFAAGAQVNDDQTWPAYLEKMLGQPVLNAGIGGYGVDQTILKAERLLDKVEPHTVIVGIQFDSIFVNTYRTYNAPKPYFVIENGELVQKNVPVPRTERAGRLIDRIAVTAKGILGYLYVADRVANELFPAWWIADETKGQFIKVKNDPVEISCRLLDRLKRELDQRRIGLLVVFQENGPITVKYEEPPSEIKGISECAREHGIQNVDTFEPLHAIAKSSKSEFNKYFLMTASGAYQHMSPEGNRFVAQIVARALEGVNLPRRAETQPSADAK